MKKGYLRWICIFLCSATVFNYPHRVSAENDKEISRLIAKFTLLPKERNEAINKIVIYGDAAIPVLIDSLSQSTTSSSAEIAINVVRTLERIGSPRAIESMGKMIREHTYRGATTRDIAIEWAIKSLEKLGPTGENELIVALRSKDNQIQYWVSEALARIGSPSAVAGLVSSLPNSHVAKALGKIRNPHAVEGLVSALPLHQAIVALGDIKDTRAIVPLLRIVHKGKNYAAEDALSEFDFPLIPVICAVAANVPKNLDLAEQQFVFTDRVLQLLVSKKLNERYLAEIAIARIGRLMMPALFKALNNSDSELLRQAVADQLGKMPGKDTENALIKALQDRNPLVVAHAARALGELGSKPALAPLTEIARSGSIYVRRGAVWAIANIDNPTKKAILKNFCSDNDEYVRRMAVSASGDS